MKNELTNDELIILKEILKNVKHSYTRGFQCKCGHVYKEKFELHDASTKNDFGSMVCRNCGENDCWKDIKIKNISCDIKKIKNLNIIEEIL